MTDTSPSIGPATYYMVEMDYPHETAAERDAFDAFYQRHIDMLLTIPGFMTAQRFHCPEATKAPFLALYRLAGPEVMTGEAYTSKAGRMSVDPDFRVNMTNWDRNLAQGPAVAPGQPPEPNLTVEMGGAMTLIDRLTKSAPPLPAVFTPLEIVGLDCSVVQRGAVTGEGGEPAAADGWEIRVWRPIHPVRLGG
jgi:hypothetical protein